MNKTKLIAVVLLIPALLIGGFGSFVVSASNSQSLFCKLNPNANQCKSKTTQTPVTPKPNPTPTAKTPVKIQVIQPVQGATSKPVAKPQSKPATKPATTTAKPVSPAKPTTKTPTPVTTSNQSFFCKINPNASQCKSTANSTTVNTAKPKTPLANQTAVGTYNSATNLTQFCRSNPWSSSCKNTSNNQKQPIAKNTNLTCTTNQKSTSSKPCIAPAVPLSQSEKAKISTTQATTTAKKESNNPYKTQCIFNCSKTPVANTKPNTPNTQQAKPVATVNTGSSGFSWSNLFNQASPLLANVLGGANKQATPAQEPIDEEVNYMTQDLSTVPNDKKTEIKVVQPSQETSFTGNATHYGEESCTNNGCLTALGERLSYSQKGVAIPLDIESRNGLGLGDTIKICRNQKCTEARVNDYGGFGCPMFKSNGERNIPMYMKGEVKRINSKTGKIEIIQNGVLSKFQRSQSELERVGHGGCVNSSTIVDMNPALFAFFDREDGQVTIAKIKSGM